MRVIRVLVTGQTHTENPIESSNNATSETSSASTSRNADVMSITEDILDAAPGDVNNRDVVNMMDLDSTESHTSKNSQDGSNHQESSGMKKKGPRKASSAETTNMMDIETSGATEPSKVTDAPILQGSQDVEESSVREEPVNANASSTEDIMDIDDTPDKHKSGEEGSAKRYTWEEIL